MATRGPLSREGDSGSPGTIEIWPAWVPFAVMGLLTAWLFRGFLFGGDRLGGSDFVVYFLPYTRFLHDHFQQTGSFPLWNPFLFGGMPFRGHFETTEFYPFNLPFCLVPPESLYGPLAVLHLLLGGWGMWLLLRCLRVGRVPALLGTMVFSLNHFFVPLLGLGRMVHFQAYAWTPWVLWGFALYVRRRAWSLSAWLPGLCWGLQILAGDPQTAFYTYLAIGLLALFHVRWTRPEMAGMLTRLVLVFCVGVGFAAVKVVPAMEFLDRTSRAAVQSYDMATLASFPLEGVITAFMPHFFGSFFEGGLWAADVPWSVPIPNLYVGVLPLLLMVFAGPTAGMERRHALFAVVLAISSLLLAMGGNTPLYRLFYELPGFSGFRAPSKILVLWMVAAGMLVAFGSQKLCAPGSRRSRPLLVAVIGSLVMLLGVRVWLEQDPLRFLTIFSPFLVDMASGWKSSDIAGIIQTQWGRFSLLLGAALAACLALDRGWVARRIWAVVAVALVAADLLGLGQVYIRSFDREYDDLVRTKGVLERPLAPMERPFRVGSSRTVYGPNVDMYYGLQTAVGAGPLILERVYRLWDSVLDRRGSGRWQALWYDMVRTSEPMELMDVQVAINHQTQRIVRLPESLPRAHLVDRWRVLPEEQTLQSMVEGRFDLSQLVLLESDPHSGEPTEKPAKAFRGICRIQEYSPDMVRIAVRTDRPAVLVLHDVFDPGWRCTVDGRETPVLRANYVFRGIRVPAGAHQVAFRYEPWSVRAGELVSSGTIILGFSALLVAGAHRWKMVRSTKVSRCWSADRKQEEA